jgi:hypothetical protein
MRTADTLGLTVLASILGFGLVGAGPSVAMGARQVATRSQLRTERPAALAEFPFRMICNHVVISVGINDSSQIDMLLDTGMPMEGAILLGEEVSEGLGLEYERQIAFGGGGAEGVLMADVAFGATLSVSDVAFPDQRIFLVRDAAFADDWPAAGIVGGTIFNYVVEIDYANSMIGLYDDVQAVPGDFGEGIDLDFTFGIPVVDAGVAIDGGETVPVTLIADTGVNDGLLLFTYSDPRIVRPEIVLEGVSGILGEGLSGDIEGSLGRVSELHLGPYVLENVIAGFPDEETMGHASVLGQNGFVGNDVFKRFTVVFDYDEGYLHLMPNDGYSEPFEWNMAGLLLGVNRDRFLQVKELMQGSPAVEIGIEPDDVILSIDGEDVRGFGGEEIMELFRRDGARMLIEIERDSERLRFTLTLRRLI